MKTNIWMPLFIGDYLADTQHLTTEQHGAYVLLLMHEWTTGPLQDDDGTLMRITRLMPDAWSIARGVLRKFFTVSTDGKLFQPRLERERAKSLEKKAGAQAKAEKAANARWKRDARSITQAVLEECPLPLPLQITNTRASDDALSEKSKEVDLRNIPEQEVLSIWKMYPKPRGSKAAGVSAIKLALKDLRSQGYGDSAAELSTRVKTWFAWDARERAKGGFVPAPGHAQGWFGKSRRRYMDDEAIPPPEPMVVLPNGLAVKRSETESDGWKTIGGVA